MFEVEGRGGTVIRRGSSGVAVASALNWYLEHVAGVNASLPLTPIVLDTPLPPVPAKVHRTTPYRVRYFFNYCTFSYSMAWWDWGEWQRMIDWMALKGVNTPLAVTGQEAVWRLVLQDLGHLGFEEPFTTFRAHGLIIRDGAKMSKSKGNVIVPDPIIEAYGADTFRLYLMFLGPFEEGGDYRDEGEVFRTIAEAGAV